ADAQTPERVGELGRGPRLLEVGEPAAFERKGDVLAVLVEALFGEAREGHRSVTSSRCVSRGYPYSTSVVTRRDKTLDRDSAPRYLRERRSRIDVQGARR